MIALIRGELLKIRTTNTWWLFGLGLVGMTALALLINCLQANYFLNEAAADAGTIEGEDAASQQAFMAAQSTVVAQAANIYTSGQFMGALFILLLGMLLVTNEFHHQTATATFLTTPHRSAVVIAKLITAMAFAALFWVITTVLSIPTGIVFLQAQDQPVSLGEWEIQRAILFNLLAFMLWALVGVGFGALIRNQVGAVVTGAVLYLVGTQLAQIIFFLIREYLIDEKWVTQAQVIVPATAAQVFISTTAAFPDAPPYWVGGLVMLAYGVLAGAIGMLIMRRRDIS